MQGYLRKGYGPLRIKQEMRQKGFTETVVEKHFATLDVDWFEKAALVRSKNSVMTFLMISRKKQTN